MWYWYALSNLTAWQAVISPWRVLLDLTMVFSPLSQTVFLLLSWNKYCFDPCNFTLVSIFFLLVCCLLSWKFSSHLFVWWKNGDFVLCFLHCNRNLISHSDIEWCWIFQSGIDCLTKLVMFLCCKFSVTSLLIKWKSHTTFFFCFCFFLFMQ